MRNRNMYSLYAHCGRPRWLLVAVALMASSASPWGVCQAKASVEVVQQQMKSVTGTVIDAQGEPVIGASILVKGTTNGVITDIDGKFVLSNVPDNAVIQVSFVGYKTQEINVDGQTSLRITLAEDSQLLNEVVVVGYGTMRKKDLTGSVIQIRPGETAMEAPKSVQDVLRGTAGLNIGLSTSAKGGGDIEVRGERSVSDVSTHSPLLILDGMPFYGELSEINPNDIGQIDVLKDASAAAVYGAKAANGVIIITTKKGVQGKPTVNFRANIGFDTRASYQKYYDADGYMQFREDWYKAETYGVNPSTGRYEAYQQRDASGNLVVPNGYYDRPDRLPAGVSLDDWRSNGSLQLTDGETDAGLYARRLNLAGVLLDNYLAGRTFDWYDNCFRTGLNQDYSVSVSGASDRINYYLSIGYTKNESAIKGDDYKAVRANMKLSGKVNKWLEISSNVNFQDRAEDTWEQSLTSILRNSPYAQYMDEDGNLVYNPMGTVNPTVPGENYDFDNQYRDLEQGYTILNSILSAKVTLPFNITYSFNASPRFRFYYKRKFQSSERPGWLPVTVGADREQSKKFEWSLNNTINWDYTFAQKHHVNVTLVQEAEEFRSWADEIIARNILPSDILGFHNTSSAGKDESSFSSSDSHQTATGLMARAFYSYDDRYMMTATIRRDGYSAFGSSKPYATFPSFGVSWAFTNEKFFQWEPMSTGKLRLSWGQNGNRSLNDPYISLANLTTGGSYGYLANSGSLEEIQYLLVERLANPNLSWEKSEAFNVGLDFGFFDDRLTGTIEGYVIDTRDMIMPKQLPVISGFDEIATNLGQVRNSGLEITLSSQNIRKENFEWNTDLTVTWNKNKVKHLYYEYEDVLDENGNIVGQKERDEYGTWFIGRDINTIWDYKVTGIWQTDEIEEAAKYGQRPGDPKVENFYTADDIINEDGTRTAVYNDNDKQFLGTTKAPVFWQMRNSFKIFKNFDFSFNLYSYWGHKLEDTKYLNQDNNSSLITYAVNIPVKEYWTPENGTNDYARLNAIGPTGAETPAIYRDRSFIRLENISIGYTLPKTFLQRWNISSAQIYATVRNVAVWHKDRHWNYGDIEFDKGGYLNRTYTLGLNLTF